MTYQVLARRFRPKTFQEVVGQEGVTGTLVQGLKSGRIAHAWLFAGPRGVGKTTTARILARALNCEKGPTPEPCGVCPVCKDFLEGRDPDVEEIDGASNRRIEDVRELRERVSYKPLRGSFRVFIIDEVHMLTREAFNALLKTLEEPPSHVIFILATTEPHKVPETIRSRCQVLTFHRIGPEEISARLRQICEAEKAPVPGEVLAEIASSVRGGMRDAESILERVLTLSSGRKEGFGIEDLRRLLGRVGLGRALGVAERLLARDLEGLMEDASSLVASGLDEESFLGEVLDALRDVLLVKVGGVDTPLLDAAKETRQRLAALAERVEVQALTAMLRAGLEGKARLRRVEEKRIALELALLQAAQAAELVDLATLLEVLREKGFAPPGAGKKPPLEAGAPAPAPRAGGGPPPASPEPGGTGPARPGGKVPRAEEAPPSGGGTPSAGPGGEDTPAEDLERFRRELARAFSSIEDQLSRSEVVRAGAKILVKVRGLSQVEMDRFKDKEGRERVARVARGVFGRDVPVRFENLSPLEGRRRPGGGPQESPGTKLLKKRFGGEAVQPPPRQVGLFGEPEGPGQGREEGQGS